MLERQGPPACRKRREPVELFHGVSVDWLGKKWYFLAFSMIFSVAGLISMGMHMRSIGSPVLLGVDFKGGTQVQVHFNQAPRKRRETSGIFSQCKRRLVGEEMVLPCQTSRRLH